MRHMLNSCNIPKMAMPGLYMYYEKHILVHINAIVHTFWSPARISCYPRTWFILPFSKLVISSHMSTVLCPICVIRSSKVPVVISKLLVWLHPFPRLTYYHIRIFHPFKLFYILTTKLHVNVFEGISSVRENRDSCHTLSHLFQSYPCWSSDRKVAFFE